MAAKHQRHLKKAELGKRRSAASQNRMRIISSLGAEVPAKKGKRNKEDTFGMDDEDWNVYRAIVSTSLLSNEFLTCVMEWHTIGCNCISSPTETINCNYISCSCQSNLINDIPYSRKYASCLWTPPKDVVIIIVVIEGLTN